MRITIEQIVKAVNGTLIRGTGKGEIEGVSIDSRKVTPKDVFFPLLGENHDAHVFIPEVVEKGCSAVVVSKEPELPAAKDTVHVILVKDTTKALQDLAAYYLSLFELKKVGVTGSTGKTTTKEMLYWILSEKYQTARNIGNFNNHIGLPLTIFTLEKGTEAAVFEMGMSEFGEIDLLADLVRPDIGIITNIGASHIENLGSRENILKAKLEITNYFQSDNILIVNEDLELLSKEKTKGNYRLITAGSTGRSSFILSNIRDHGEDGIEFAVEHKGELQDFRLFVPGRHNAYNGVLAVAAAACLGISMKEAAEGLKKMVITDKRLNIKGKNGMKIIDDTYNASPDSMRAAIDVLISTIGVRKIAILGDMFELGEKTKQFHYEIGQYAGEQGVDLVIAVGSLARHIAEGALTKLEKNKVIHYETKELLMKDIGSMISSGDVILLKGSRGMAMDQVVKRIME